MCGIAGIWSKKKDESLAATLKGMTDSIAHRGPDGEGSWISDSGVALGHRRLAIIDLSTNAGQPMHYMERYVLTFNGEIYNYLEIKSELLAKNYIFTTQSDSEVLIAAYHEWGVDCLSRFDGMFAFAIYDRLKDELFCARDRFGEKPFYFSFHKQNLVFGSEMKVLWAYGVPRIPSDKMMYNFLVHDLVENPHDQRDTFFEGIHKLKPAHYFIYRGENEIKQVNYWKVDTSGTNHYKPQELTERFMELLTGSLQRRLRSDVPVGSSLSGGLDSSTIVALVSQLVDNNHTFSARFPGFKKDEGHYIDIVQQRFHTSHHNVVVDEEKLMPSLDKLMWHQEEPFQSGSIFAQYCVYEEARKNGILVMLDGQGADEYLGGYDKDFKIYFREIFSAKAAAETFSRQIKENHNYDLQMSGKEKLLLSNPALYKLMGNVKKKLFSSIPEGVHASFHKEFAHLPMPFQEFNKLKEALHYETTNQGLEKLLKFADRNSMAHSLEVRLPFLSHELVEFVFSLRSDLLMENGWSKAILRNAAENLLPQEIVRRKDKIGFEAPHQKWIENIHFQEQYREAKQYLTENKYITDAYSNRWKSLIAYKFLKG